MAMSVRLDKETELVLAQTASVLRTTKSSVVKMSLREYCARVLREKRKHPYELIRDLLDQQGSGIGDLSIRGEEILRSRLRKRAAGKQARRRKD